MYNDYMYGVERNDEFLAHYGIRGMKWGVRKAIKSGNSARLSKQYAKASKKLAKLEKRAANSGKYAKRAALMGAGAAVAGATAGFGPGKVTKYAMLGAGNVTKGAGSAAVGVGNLLTKSRNAKVRAIGFKTKTAGYKAQTAGSKVNIAGYQTGKAIDTWGKGHELSRGAAAGLNKFGSNIQAAAAKGSKLQKQAASKVGTTAWKAGNAVNAANLSNNTIARIGAGAIGAGLAAGAAKNAYRAATAKKKAAKFKSEMNKAFAGTKYANGGARQGKKRRR